MKEIVFIKQNLAKWKNVEQRLDNIQAESPESLSNLYFDITSDLSFAQTNYPHRQLPIISTILPSHYILIYIVVSKNRGAGSHFLDARGTRHGV